MSGNDGWQIKAVEGGWVALYTPDVDNLDETLPAKRVYETRAQAERYARSNYTANGIVDRP